MKKNDKKLQKALSLFENGNYEEALNICGKILEKDYNNEEALTLESRILYYYGDLNEAKLTWKINSDYNDNIESKEFLNNVNEYAQLKELYESALKDIENGLVDEATKKLEKCSSSTFNKLNIEKALESCSDIKKGITPTSIKSSYEEQKSNSLIHSLVDEKITKEIRAAIQEELAKKEKLEKNSKVEDTQENKKNVDKPIIEKALPQNSEHISKDTVEKVNLETKKTLENINKTSVEENKDLHSNSNHRIPEVAPKSNKSYGKAIKISTVVIAGVLVASIAYTTIKNTNFSSGAQQGNEITNNTNNNSNNNEANTAISHKFEAKKFQTAIKDKNINELYTLLTTTSKDTLTGEDLNIYNKAEEIMSVEGVEKFYNEGLSLFKEKKYTDSIPLFEKALKFSDKSYLQRHIIYFIASANDNLNNKPEAVKYYEMYLNKFLKSDSQGDDPFYSPEVLYKLANYYKDSDKELSKKYASLIESDFPNSIFYNDVTLKLIYN